MNLTRRTLRRIVVLLVAAVCVYVACHFYALAARSRAAVERLARSLSQDGDSVPLTTLLPASAMKDGAPAYICILGPYAELRHVPQLAEMDLGLDAWWLASVDESSIGVVALDADGNDVARLWLSRGKVDFDWECGVGAQCYRPAGVTLEKIGTPEDGRLMLRLKPSYTVP